VTPQWRSYTMQNIRSPASFSRRSRPGGIFWAKSNGDCTEVYQISAPSPNKWQRVIKYVSTGNAIISEPPLPTVVSLSKVEATAYSLSVVIYRLYSCSLSVRFVISDCMQYRRETMQ